MARTSAPFEPRIGTTRRFTLASGALLFVALGAAGYLLFGSSDERRILTLLRELLASASSLPRESDAERARRFRAALERSTLPDVTVSVPELGTFEGRDEILAGYALADGTELRFGVEQFDLRVRKERAEATVLTSLLVKVPGEERRQLRTASVRLERREGRFLIASINISAIVEVPPEARP
jgi:hypothetical protein